ncbi:MAG: hypothetical protein RLZZ127_37 [Planctomycetota bacterium]|jgi:DNA polymerase III epsilon subunit family exonuclease
MSRIVFDTETTGVDDGSRLLELAAVALDDKDQVVGEFAALANPGMPLPADVGGVNGITADMLADAPGTRDVLTRWLEWLGEHGATAAIAHFAPFDCGILGWEFGRVGLALPPLRVIDTCAMARTIGETKKNSLVALVEHYGIQRQGTAHRAMSDVRACLDYYRIAKAKTKAQDEAWPRSYWHPTALPAHLAALPEMVAAGAPFRFVYQDAKGNLTERTITPLGYAETAKGISFHGWCHLRNERRNFLAERVVVG